MIVRVLQDTSEGSEASTALVAERDRGSVNPVKDAEPDEAWFDDPDAHYSEVVYYMRRLHRRCGSSEEFVAALSGLFPDLEDKLARISAGAEIDFGSDNEADSEAELGPGPWVCFRSTAEMVASDLAKIADPGGRDPSQPPDEAWFDDPDAHLREVVDYMERLHVRCDSSDEFVDALSGLFPDLREKIDKARALASEDLSDDELPDPGTAAASGRVVTFLSGAEMLAADLAMLSELGGV